MILLQYASKLAEKTKLANSSQRLAVYTVYRRGLKSVTTVGRGLTPLNVSNQFTIPHHSSIVFCQRFLRWGNTSHQRGSKNNTLSYCRDKMGHLIDGPQIWVSYQYEAHHKLFSYYTESYIMSLVWFVLWHRPWYTIKIPDVKLAVWIEFAHTHQISPIGPKRAAIAKHMWPDLWLLKGFRKAKNACFLWRHWKG